jgi:hypothetical protein
MNAAVRNGWITVRDAGEIEPTGRTTIAFWAASAILFYLPFAFPDLAYVQADDLLDSEVVYNVAAGRLWLGDTTILSAFLNGKIEALALPRLTQPLTGLYALFPPFAAFWITDLVVRAVAAVGAFLLLRRIGSPTLLAHLAAALFALNMVNSTYLLSVVGLPAATYLLLCRRNALNIGLLLLIGWNSSAYLSGPFYCAIAPALHRFVFSRPLDRDFLFGLGAYGAGLALGNFGFVWLLLTSNERWHREEFGVDSIVSFPTPFIHLGTFLYFLLLAAGTIAIRDGRGRRLLLLAAFVLLWYAAWQLPGLVQWQRRLPPLFASFQLDRIFFLWTFLILILTGLAAGAASSGGRLLLLAAILLEVPFAAIQHQHLRHLLRVAFGKAEGLPPFAEYYGFEWFQRRKLDRDVVVLSVGVPPMAAPINGIRSIDGYFQLYPLEYKRRFLRVIAASMGPAGKAKDFDEWGSELMAYYPQGQPELINFCAARDLGANHVIAAEPIRSSLLNLVAQDSWLLYRIDCPAGRAGRVQPARPE